MVNSFVCKRVTLNVYKLELIYVVNINVFHSLTPSIHMQMLPDPSFTQVLVADNAKDQISCKKVK